MQGARSDFTVSTHSFGITELANCTTGRDIRSKDSTFGGGSECVPRDSVPLGSVREGRGVSLSR